MSQEKTMKKVIREYWVIGRPGLGDQECPVDSACGRSISKLHDARVEFEKLLPDVPAGLALEAMVNDQALVILNG
jgi:hypothetical protein